MEFQQLGHTTLQVSRLSLGSWLTYEYMTEPDALAVLRAGLEAGINFLDDARYDDKTGHAPMKSGYSEVVFGRLLKKSSWKREELIIANKLWYEFYPQQSPEAEVDGSLSRLGLEYLDLIYCLPPADLLPVAEIVQQMDALIKTGKVRHWGVANWRAEKIREAYQIALANKLTPPCAAQLPYSLLNTSWVEGEENSVIFEATGIGIVASYSLHGGLLSGKYNQGKIDSDGRFAADELDKMRQDGLLDGVDTVIAIARELGCTPAQLALAYCLKNDQVASLLFGAKKVAQLQENIQSLSMLPGVDREVMARLVQP